MTVRGGIASLRRTSPAVSQLADLLIEVVAANGSVSFMHPLERQAAESFWEASLEAAERDERVVLGAFEDGELIGTVTLLLALPQNQPHRAELAKLMTRPSRRRQGIARALLIEAERIAAGRGRSLITLDTSVDGGAGALYQGLGYEKAGTIPDYALTPLGQLTGTIIYFKRIGPLIPQ